MSEAPGKLRLGALVALVVGSMIGGGIFSLPQNMAANTYLSLIYLATSMILVPYLWSAAYALPLAVRGASYEGAAGERRKDLIIGAVALIYAVWLLYADGIKYLLLSALLYAPRRDPVRQGQAGDQPTGFHPRREADFRCGGRGRRGGGLRSL
jgi:amino acid transporter